MIIASIDVFFFFGSVLGLHVWFDLADNSCFTESKRFFFFHYYFMGTCQHYEGLRIDCLMSMISSKMSTKICLRVRLRVPHRGTFEIALNSFTVSVNKY